MDAVPMTPRSLTRLAVGALAAGLVLGVMSRLAMRFVALESGLAGGFSAGGSLEVVLFGALVGAPVALMFALLRPHMAWKRPWLGVATGLSLFAALAAFQPPAARSALDGTPDTPGATALAFAVVFLLWGAGLDWFASRRPLVGSQAAPGAPR